MSDIENILKVIELPKVVKHLLGVAEAIDLRLEELINSELSTAVTCLKQASLSENEAVSLLRASRDHFNKALHLEKGARLALAYFGLGLCHHCLGDLKNAKEAMLEIKNNRNYVPKFGHPAEEILKFIFSWNYDPFKRKEMIQTAIKIFPIQKEADAYLNIYGR